MPSSGHTVQKSSRAAEAAEQEDHAASQLDDEEEMVEEVEEGDNDDEYESASKDKKARRSKQIAEREQDTLVELPYKVERILSQRSVQCIRVSLSSLVFLFLLLAPHAAQNDPAARPSRGFRGGLFVPI
jgi:hypothetical protein